MRCVNYEKQNNGSSRTEALGAKQSTFLSKWTQLSQFLDIRQ